MIVSKPGYLLSDAALKTPFDNIALAFSGGGFRAASFALGTLSYMHELIIDEEQSQSGTLLDHVRYISSASGGTIASAMYALSQAQGKPFDEFYKNLFENLDGTSLLKEVFRVLNTKSEWKKRAPKTRNLINAFAVAYDEQLFKGATVA